MSKKRNVSRFKIREIKYPVLSQFTLSFVNFFVSLSMMRQNNMEEFGVFVFLLSLFFIINALNSASFISYINNVCPSKKKEIFYSNIKQLIKRNYSMVVAQCLIAVFLNCINKEIFGVNSSQIALMMIASITWIIYEIIRRIYIYENKTKSMFRFDLLWASVAITYGILYQWTVDAYFGLYFLVSCISILHLYLNIGDFRIKRKDVDGTFDRSLFFNFSLTGVYLQLLSMCYIQLIQIVLLSKGGAAMLSSFEGPRIIIMPIMTLTIGIVNYSNLKLRMIYSQYGFQEFHNELIKILMFVLIISSVYATVVVYLYNNNFFNLILNGFDLRFDILLEWMVISIIIIISTFLSMVYVIDHKPKLAIIGRTLSALSAVTIVIIFYSSLNIDNIALVRIFGEVIILITVIFIYTKIKKSKINECSEYS